MTSHQNVRLSGELLGLVRIVKTAIRLLVEKQTNQRTDTVMKILN